MEPKRTAIYLCEDERELARALIGALEPRYRVSWSPNGEGALEAVRAGEAEILILDRKLQDADGMEILAALRDGGARTPVLMISGLGAVDDRVAGLRAGGDDYLVKPFAMPEFLARVDALARRLPVEGAALLRAGTLELDLIGRKLRRGDRGIELLPREFKLLEYFMRRPGQVVTRKMLLEEVWGYCFNTETNVVDVHIRNLRVKLDAPGEPKLIVNLRGQGFRLDVPA